MKVTTLNRELKKVTAEQMDMLFEFTRKHYVEYYDVQCELADHLANAIEERWETQPNLGFNEALHFEFKKFGIFGFTGIVEKRQLALGKKYKKLMWQYLKEFIRIPQILITIVLLLMVYKAISFSQIVYYILSLSTFLLSFIVLIIRVVKYRKKVKQIGKKWLFEETIAHCGGMAGMTYIPFHFSTIFDLDSPSTSIIKIVIMTIVVVLFMLIQYVVLFVIPRRAEEHLLKTYPEYNFEIS